MLIVGAGVAGLAAAQALCATGYAPLALEARDRVGACSPTGGLCAPVELSAEFRV